MFTGLVTDVGRIRSVEHDGDTRVTIECAYDTESIHMGASICCAGVCLTVVEKGDGWFAIDVSDETLSCTTLGNWGEGSAVNLERSLRLGDEMGGHIVTGHVDCVGEITAMSSVNASCKMDIIVPLKFAKLLVSKGSVCVDGTSLTVNKVVDRAYDSLMSINLIPHTQDATSFKHSTVGDKVNLEFDILARYVARMQNIAL
jgi:riboflavin synthase